MHVSPLLSIYKSNALFLATTNNSKNVRSRRGVVKTPIESFTSSFPTSYKLCTMSPKRKRGGEKMNQRAKLRIEVQKKDFSKYIVRAEHAVKRSIDTGEQIPQSIYQGLQGSSERQRMRSIIRQEGFSKGLWTKDTVKGLLPQWPHVEQLQRKHRKTSTPTSTPTHTPSSLEEQLLNQIKQAQQEQLKMKLRAETAMLSAQMAKVVSLERSADILWSQTKAYTAKPVPIIPISLQEADKLRGAGALADKPVLVDIPVKVPSVDKPVLLDKPVSVVVSVDKTAVIDDSSDLHNLLIDDNEVPYLASS